MHASDFYLKPKYNTKRLRDEEKYKNDQENFHRQYLENVEERWFRPHKCRNCGSRVKRVVGGFLLSGHPNYPPEKYYFESDSKVYYSDDPYKDEHPMWICEECGRRYYSKFLLCLKKIVRLFRKSEIG